MRLLIKRISIVVSLCFSGTTFTSEHELSDPVAFSGFGTIGMVNAGGENLGFRRDLTREAVYDSDWSFKQDSLLGVQIDARLSSRTKATVQLVARDRPDNAVEESIEWLFLRHEINDQWVGRVGRVGVDLFALSDYHSVGFAYTWASPPSEFYGPVATSYMDGADLTYSRLMSDGYLSLKLFGGVAENSLAEGDGAKVSIEPLLGVAASLEFDKWSGRIGLASVELDSESSAIRQLGETLRQIPAAIWPEAARIADEVSTKGEKFNYFSFALTFDDRPWLIESEIGYIDSDFEYFPSVANAYVSLGYRVNALTFYGVISRAKNTEDRESVAPPLNPPIAPDPANPVYGLYQGVQFIADKNGTDQRTFSLGLRWDFRDDIALKLQWDHHNVERYGNYLWGLQTPSVEGDELDTFTINLSFVF